LLNRSLTAGDTRSASGIVVSSGMLLTNNVNTFVRTTFLILSIASRRAIHNAELGGLMSLLSSDITKSGSTIMICESYLKC
jgi:hypothetical protein